MALPKPPTNFNATLTGLEYAASWTPAPGVTSQMFAVLTNGMRWDFQNLAADVASFSMPLAKDSIYVLRIISVNADGMQLFNTPRSIVSTYGTPQILPY